MKNTNHRFTYTQGITFFTRGAISWEYPKYTWNANLARTLQDFHFFNHVTWWWFIVPTFDTKVTEYLCSGWVFLFRQNFDFLTSHFWRNFFISFKRYCCPELKFETIFHLWSFFVDLWEFKDCHFDQFGTINARYNSRYQRVSGDLIRLRNCFKLIERSSFAIIDLLQGTKSILLYFIWRVGEGMIFIKNFKF